MKKFLVILSIIVFTVFIALQTPYFARSSEILRSSDGSNNCVKIVKRKIKDRNISRGFASANFFSFYVPEWPNFKSHISLSSKVSENLLLSLKAKRIDNLRSCGIEVISNNLYKLVDETNKQCKVSYPNKSDVFFTNNPKDLGQIFCRYVNNEDATEGYKFCTYNGIYKDWSWNFNLPVSHLREWKKALDAANSRLDASIEVLPFCPVIIPFM